MTYTQRHLRETEAILGMLDVAAIERLAELLAQIKASAGRIFFIGVGGSAANCSHAVNDFRKLAGIESYAPTDNVSELTARINDDGWESSFVEWLKVSLNLVAAVSYAKATGAKVLGIVGRDGGVTARIADAAVIVPTVNPATVTPHAESFQAVIWHLLVFHPLLNAAVAS